MVICRLVFACLLLMASSLASALAAESSTTAAGPDQAQEMVDRTYSFSGERWIYDRSSKLGFEVCLNEDYKTYKISGNAKCPGKGGGIEEMLTLFHGQPVFNVSVKKPSHDWDSLDVSYQTEARPPTLIQRLTSGYAAFAGAILVILSIGLSFELTRRTEKLAYLMVVPNIVICIVHVPALMSLYGGLFFNFSTLMVFTLSYTVLTFMLFAALADLGYYLTPFFEPDITVIARFDPPSQAGQSAASPQSLDTLRTISANASTPPTAIAEGARARDREVLEQLHERYSRGADQSVETVSIAQPDPVATVEQSVSGRRKIVLD